MVSNGPFSEAGENYDALSIRERGETPFRELTFNFNFV